MHAHGAGVTEPPRGGDAALQVCISLTPPYCNAATDVAGLQRPDGCFVGDEGGEVDTRFTYAALLTLSILGRTDAVDVAAAVDFVVACKNFDGGFGCTPGASPGAAHPECG